MAMARLLASYDAGAADDAQSTASADREQAIYYDPITGETLDLARTAPNARREALISKDRLYKLQQDQQLQGRLRPEPATAEWDHLVFDLTSYGARAADAWAVIRTTMQNPDYAVRKNQGGGRFQDITVQGRRGVVDWGVHQNRNDGLIHGHLFTHRYVIGGGSIKPMTSMQTKLFADTEISNVNTALIANGFAPLLQFDMGGGSTSKPQAMPRDEQHAVADAAVASVLSGAGQGDVQQALEAATAATSTKQGIIGDAQRTELLARGLEAARQAAAQAVEAAKRHSEQAAQIQIALETMHTNKRLENTVAQHERQLAADAEKITILNETLRVKDETLAANDASIRELDSTIEQQQTALLQTSSRLQDTEAELGRVNEEFAALETENAELKTERDDLTATLDAERAQFAAMRADLAAQIEAEKQARVRAESEAAARLSEAAAQLEAERNAHAATRAEAIEQRSMLQRALDAMTQAKDEMIAGLREAMAELRARITGVETRHDKATEELTQARAEIDRLRTQLERRSEAPTDAASDRLSALQTGLADLQKAHGSDGLTGLQSASDHRKKKEQEEQQRAEKKAKPSDPGSKPK